MIDNALLKYSSIIRWKVGLVKHSYNILPRKGRRIVPLYNTIGENLPPLLRSRSWTLEYNENVDTLLTGLRAALFDLDGTLIETHIDFAGMKRETLALVSDYGVETDNLAALDILSIVEAARERLEASGQREAGDRLRADAFALLQRIEIQQCASPTEVPGASELLFRLRAWGIPVGIVTRNCRLVSERLLHIGNLPCDVLVTRDDVPRTKPDPLHLLTTLQLLEKRGGEKRLLPSAAVMVGDHWMDIQAGRAAGMRTIGILRGRDAGFFAPAPPDRLIHELAELLPCIGENVPHEPNTSPLRRLDHPLHRHRQLEYP